MMRIELHKNFEKAFAKLNSKQKRRVKETIERFKRNPYDLRLKNHALKDELQGYRAISTGGDLRLIFQGERKYEQVQFVLVGIHTQVYE